MACRASRVPAATRRCWSKRCDRQGCTEASGGTRRAKIPGEPCTGLLARTSPGCALREPPTKIRIAIRIANEGYAMLRKLAAIILAASLSLPIDFRRRRGAQERLQDMLVDLCRLDAVGLSLRQRHHEEMGRQIRHQCRDHPHQRLCRKHQPVHRRRLRRLRDDQHGRAVDPRRRRRRHHRLDHRRLLQRQRCRDPQGQGSARRHCRPEGQPRRALRLALPAGAGAGHGRARREGHHRRQHVRRRHGRRLRHQRRHLGRHLEPAGFRDRRHAGRAQGVRFRRRFPARSST